MFLSTMLAEWQTTTLDRVGYPTLVFAITTLNLLMSPFLDFTLENPGSRWLVKTSYFKNMCSIDPIVASSAHNTFAIDFELVNWNLLNCVRLASRRRKGQNGWKEALGKI